MGLINMLSIKKKLSDLLKHFSNDKTTQEFHISDSFIHKYLNGDVGRQQPEIFYARNPDCLPVWEICPLKSKVLAASTGPDGGLTTISVKKKTLTFDDSDVEFIDGVENDTEKSHIHLLKEYYVAGIENWNNPTSFAYGISTTLYESNPFTLQPTGNPIADAYAVIARENNAILALADGVNWGEKASLAARCAVYGCIDYLNNIIFEENLKFYNTSTVFTALLRSFLTAHSLILEEGGLLTTLTVAIIVPLLTKEYAICVCNVGDSLAYIYNTRKGVYEVTQGSHDIYSIRNMRDALGALGPVDGTKPELSNLTCSMTLANDGDIVFLTSDGISDNFDPVVGKFCLSSKMKNSSKFNKPIHNFPTAEAFQRHELSLLRMEDLIMNGFGSNITQSHTAQELCSSMVQFSVQLTSAKRKMFEELYKVMPNNSEDLNQRQTINKQLVMFPGKLDHATIVAYQIGNNGNV